MAGLLVLFALVLGGAAIYFAMSPESFLGAETRPAFTDRDANESHRVMVESLAIIQAQTLSKHPYLGDEELKQIRGTFADMEGTATATQLCDLHLAAGIREGRLGNIREMIGDFQKAVELLPTADFDDAKKMYIKFKLAVAYLRLGETENCCISGGPESCIVPIGPAGVHRKVEGSKTAAAYFEQILREGGGDEVTHTLDNVLASTETSVKVILASRWLLNIAHMTLGTYPDGVPEEFLIPESVFESSIDVPRFKNIARDMGLDKFDNCGGVIVDDFDSDDLLDIIVSSWDPTEQMSYFHNNGDGTFSDRTEEVGLKGLLGGLNLNQADFNNDGHIDFYVMRGAWLQQSGKMPNSLVRNNGDGTFTDITFVCGLASDDFPSQVSSWADYDNDGDLDLFVGNETDKVFKAPCQLYRNNGDETFTDVAKQAGVENLRFTKGAAWGDYDNDGDMDLYLSNLRDNNRLYRNNGDGTFTDVAPELGVVDPQKSFPPWFFDYDNDGDLDLFVTAYSAMVDNLVSFHCGLPTDFEPGALFENDGKGNFTNVTEARGLNVPLLTMGANFGDLNNDGFLDFYLGTGNPEYESLTPNLMFLNQGGKKFVDVTMAAGFGHLQKGHAIAFADLDNDGDTDVFEQMGGAFTGDKFGNAFFANPGFDTRFIKIQLVGDQSNRFGVGARIKVVVIENGKERSIYRHVNSGASFGANPLRQMVGLGKAEKIKELVVDWPTSGISQRFENLEIDSAYRIFEGKQRPEPIKLEKLNFQ